MRAINNQKIKEKRIVYFWDELSKLRLSTEAAMELICYMFNVSESWVYRIIKQSPEALEGVDLPHADLDKVYILAYFDKIKANAKSV